MEDQSIRAVSFYPSDGALFKMAYRAGFPNVYRFRELPDHEDYRAMTGRTRVRTMMAASLSALNLPLLEAAPDWSRQVKTLALDYGLLSSFTAFVAVDSSRQTEGTSGTTVPVPVPVPEGVRYETTVTK